MKPLRPPRKVQVVLWRRTDHGPEVLLLRVTAERGAFWQPVTGGCEVGETFAAAAAREAQEETGWDGLPPPVDLGFVHRYPIPAEKARRYEPGSAELEERAFAVACDRHRDPALDPHEHDAFAWLPVEDALARCRFEPNREAIRRAVAHSSG